MQDIVVIQNLQRRGADFSNMQEMLRYEAMERKPRVLDKPPKRITLTKAKEVVVFGYKEELIATYQNLLETCTGPVYGIDIKGVSRYCDKEVFALLQSLIYLGMTNTQLRADACFEVFRTIVMCQCDTLTTERIYRAIKEIKSDNYYVNETVAAINLCLYNNTSIEMYWKSLIDFKEFYGKAQELGGPYLTERCETEKDVRKLLSDAYKSAKEDKDFMNNIYKGGVNKWMIGMLYLLKDEHPEVLQPSSSNIGFA